MQKDIYDKTLGSCVKLKEQIKRLDKCMKEKEQLLKKIEEYKAKGTFENKFDEIEKQLKENLKKFRKVVEAIKSLNKNA